MCYRHQYRNRKSPESAGSLPIRPSLTQFQKKGHITRGSRGGVGGGLTDDGLGASHTLLGVEVTEAVQAVGEVLPGGEALPRQGLLAADAQEAVPVPGLLLVGDPACGDGLEEGKGYTLHTLHTYTHT